MTTIITKNSSTTGAAPTSGDLVQGELAVNVTDTGLYTENASGTIVKLNAPSIDDKNTGATKYVTIASGGNVGIGTSSPGSVSGYRSLNIKSTSGGELQLGNSAGTAQATLWSDANGLTYNNHGSTAHIWNTGGAEKMRIDSSGNVGIGTTVTNGRLNVYGPGVYQAIYNTSATANDTHSATIQAYGTYWNKLVLDGSQLIFNAYGAERARIDSSGNLLVGTTTASAKITSNVTGGSNNYMAYGDTTTTAAYLYWGYAASASRFIVYGNGGIANVQANNVNLSDRSEKTDFSSAGSYLDKICAIPVQTFKYIDQQDDELNLGVVAQDVQAVAPELVTEGNWGTPDEPKMRLSIYQTDLQYALMKCIQELKAELDAAKADIAALKGQA